MRSKMIVGLIASVTTLAMISQPLNAAGTSVSAAYPQSVADAIQDQGYKAEIDTDSYGDPMVRSAAEGVNFTLTFYGCENGSACTDIMFTVAFDKTNGMKMEPMNSWNLEKALGRAFLDDEMDPVLQHYMLSVDGMSRSTFDDNFSRWVGVMDEFTDYIDW